MTTRMPGNHNPNSVKDRVKGEIRDRVKGQSVIEHRVELVIEVEQRVKLVIEVGQVERIEVSGTSEGSFRDECTCASGVPTILASVMPDMSLEHCTTSLLSDHKPRIPEALCTVQA